VWCTCAPESQSCAPCQPSLFIQAQSPSVYDGQTGFLFIGYPALERVPIASLASIGSCNTMQNQVKHRPEGQKLFKSMAGSLWPRAIVDGTWLRAWHLACSSCSQCAIYDGTSGSSTSGSSTPKRHHRAASDFLHKRHTPAASQPTTPLLSLLPPSARAASTAVLTLSPQLSILSNRLSLLSLCRLQLS
jgi:hypothetical protein